MTELDSGRVVSSAILVPRPSPSSPTSYVIQVTFEPCRNFRREKAWKILVPCAIELGGVEWMLCC